MRTGRDSLEDELLRVVNPILLTYMGENVSVSGNLESLELAEYGPKGSPGLYLIRVTALAEPATLVLVPDKDDKVAVFSLGLANDQISKDSLLRLVKKYKLGTALNSISYSPDSSLVDHENAVIKIVRGFNSDPTSVAACAQGIIDGLDMAVGSAALRHERTVHKQRIKANKELEGLVSEHEKAIETLEEEVAVLRKALKPTRQRPITEAGEVIDQQTEWITRLARREQEVAALAAQLEADRAYHDEEMWKAQQAIDALKGELVQLRPENEELLEFADALREEVTALGGVGQMNESLSQRILELESGHREMQDLLDEKVTKLTATLRSSVVPNVELAEFVLNAHDQIKLCSTLLGLYQRLTLDIAVPTLYAQLQQVLSNSETHLNMVYERSFFSRLLNRKKGETAPFDSSILFSKRQHYVAILENSMSELNEVTKENKELFDWISANPMTTNAGVMEKSAKLTARVEAFLHLMAASTSELMNEFYPVADGRYEQLKASFLQLLLTIYAQQWPELSENGIDDARLVQLFGAELADVTMDEVFARTWPRNQHQLWQDKKHSAHVLIAIDAIKMQLASAATGECLNQLGQVLATHLCMHSLEAQAVDAFGTGQKVKLTAKFEEHDVKGASAEIVLANPLLYAELGLTVRHYVVTLMELRKVPPAIQAGLLQTLDKDLTACIPIKPVGYKKEQVMDVLNKVAACVHRCVEGNAFASLVMATKAAASIDVAAARLGLTQGPGVLFPVKQQPPPTLTLAEEMAAAAPHQ